MNAAAQITEETLASITKAQTTGILESTGFYSYDLSELVSLIPVVTPFRDLVTRKKSTDGNPYAVWRAIMNLNSSQPDPSMGFDYAANEVVFSEQDFQARYKPTGYAGLVTQDAFDLATGYADPYAVATFQTLNQVLIGDDRKLMGAQSFALATTAAPILTQHATGGSIGAVSLYIAAAARTGSGYYYGSGNSQATSSAVSTFGSGSTNSVTAVVAALRGAVCYDWFYSANGSTWYYYTTTTTNTVTITQTISSNQALPTGLPGPVHVVEGHRERGPDRSTTRRQRLGERQRLRRLPGLPDRRLQRLRAVGPARHRHRQPVRVATRSTAPR